MPPQQKVFFIIWRRKIPQQLCNLHFPQNFIRNHLGTFEILGCHERTPEHGQHRRMTRKLWFAKALFLFERCALGLKRYSALSFPARFCIFYDGKSNTEKRTFWKQFLMPDNFEFRQSVSQGQLTIQVYSDDLFLKLILGLLAL